MTVEAAKAISSIRKHLGISQEEFGHLIGKGLTAIHLYETGKRPIPPAVGELIMLMLDGYVPTSIARTEAEKATLRRVLRTIEMNALPANVEGKPE